MSTTPFTIRANADAQLVPLPESETKIRQNIQYLFFRMLGETVDVNSDDVTRAYTLFVDVWKDLEAKGLTDKKDLSIGNYRCIAESDWDKAVRFEPDQNGNIRPVFDKLRDRPDKAPYEPGMRLDRDENFTVRSWQAVVTYLLTDYRFTHE